MVEKPLRDAGRVGDVLDRDVFVPAGGEKLDAELEQLGAAFIRLKSKSTARHHQPTLTLLTRRPM
jgi:hypothetical protein